MPEGIRQHRFSPPAGATRLILVRHGESAAAVPGDPFPLRDGHGDPPLHPQGRRQAIAVAAALATLPIAAIYVSTLQRTHQTAAPLAGLLALTPVEIADLREVFLGDWEGGVFRERILANDPLVAEIASNQRWDVIPNSEPQSAFAHRLDAAVRDLAALHPNETIAAFVHGGVIGQILATATGADGMTFAGSDNGSISELVVLGNQRILRLFNSVSHLRGLEE